MDTLLAAPPAPDSAEAWAGTISLSVRWFFRDDYARLWQARRRWFVGQYRWKAIDAGLEFDIDRWCTKA